jgi:hypothetical protein
LWCRPAAGTLGRWTKSWISRSEITALLFTISDISVTLDRIEALLKGEDDYGEEEVE